MPEENQNIVNVESGEDVFDLGSEENYSLSHYSFSKNGTRNIYSITNESRKKGKTVQFITHNKQKNQWVWLDPNLDSSSKVNPENSNVDKIIFWKIPKSITKKDIYLKQGMHTIYGASNIVKWQGSCDIFYIDKTYWGRSVEAWSMDAFCVFGPENSTGFVYIVAVNDFTKQPKNPIAVYKFNTENKKWIDALSEWKWNYKKLLNLAPEKKDITVTLDNLEVKSGQVMNFNRLFNENVLLASKQILWNSGLEGDIVYRDNDRKLNRLSSLSNYSTVYNHENSKKSVILYHGSTEFSTAFPGEGDVRSITQKRLAYVKDEGQYFSSVNIEHYHKTHISFSSKVTEKLDQKAKTLWNQATKFEICIFKNPYQKIDNEFIVSTWENSFIEIGEFQTLTSNDMKMLSLSTKQRRDNGWPVRSDIFMKVFKGNENTMNLRITLNSDY